MSKVIPGGLRSVPADQLDVAAVESFAREFRETNKGKWLDNAEKVSGTGVRTEWHFPQP